MVNPEEIRLFSIVNADGSEVVLSNLGAGIVSIVVPDRNGRLAEIGRSTRLNSSHLA